MRSKCYFYLLSILAIIVSYNCHVYKGLVNQSLSDSSLYQSDDTVLAFFDISGETVIPTAGFNGKRHCKVNMSIRTKALDNDFQIAPPPDDSFCLPVVFSKIESIRFASYKSHTLSTNLHAVTSRGPPCIA